MFDLEKISAAIGFPVTTEATAQQLFRIYYKGYAQWCLANGVKEVIAPWQLVPRLFACFEERKEAKPQYDEKMMGNIEAFIRAGNSLKKPSVHTTDDYSGYQYGQNVYNAALALAKYEGGSINRVVFAEVTDPLTQKVTYSVTTYKEKQQFHHDIYYNFATVFKKYLDETGVRVKDLRANKEKLDDLFGIDFKVAQLGKSGGVLGHLGFHRDNLLSEYVNSVQYALVNGLTRDNLQGFYNVCNEAKFPFLDPYFWATAIKGIDSNDLLNSLNTFKESLIEKTERVATHSTPVIVPTRGKVEIPQRTGQQLQDLENLVGAMTKETARIYQLVSSNELIKAIFPNTYFVKDGKAPTSLDQWFSRLKAAINDKDYWDKVKDTNVFGKAELEEEGLSDSAILTDKTTLVRYEYDYKLQKDIPIQYEAYKCRLCLDDFISNWGAISKAYALPINLKNIKEYITKYELDK